MKLFGNYCGDSLLPSVLQGLIWKALREKILELGGKTEAIVERKKLHSSCYDRKCRKMCFLSIRSAGNEAVFDLYLRYIWAFVKLVNMFSPPKC